jgi:hypothetical protein
MDALRAGHRVAFATATEWVARLTDAKRDGRLEDELAALGRIPLLIVDEVGCAPRGANEPGWVRGPPAGRRNGRLKLGAARPPEVRRRVGQPRRRRTGLPPAGRVRKQGRKA